MPSLEAIRIKGIRQNNLKGFDLDLPLSQLIVVTGLSGAGKSSLVFETLHAEGQRRYVETFSPYTRQFMETLDRPKVDSVENIRPSIAISQGNTVKTSRSSVGTMTELCDYFKVWFANVARLIDPDSGEPIREESPESVWNEANLRWPNKKCLVAFKVPIPENLPADAIISGIKAQGFARLYLDGQVVKVDAFKAHQLKFQKQLCILQDRVKLESDSKLRFIEAAEAAFRFGKGTLSIIQEDDGELTDFHQGLRSPLPAKPTATPPLPFSRLTLLLEHARPVGDSVGLLKQTTNLSSQTTHSPSRMVRSRLSMVESTASACVTFCDRQGSLGYAPIYRGVNLMIGRENSSSKGRKISSKIQGIGTECAASLNGRRAEPIKCMFECSCPVSGHTLTAQTAWAHDFKKRRSTGNGRAKLFQISTRLQSQN